MLATGSVDCSLAQHAQAWQIMHRPLLQNCFDAVHCFSLLELLVSANKRL